MLLANSNNANSSHIKMSAHNQHAAFESANGSLKFGGQSRCLPSNGFLRLMLLIRCSVIKCCPSDVSALACATSTGLNQWLGGETGPCQCGSVAFAHSVTQERFIFELIPGKIIVVLIKGTCSAPNARTSPPAAKMIRPGKHSSDYGCDGI